MKAFMKWAQSLGLIVTEVRYHAHGKIVGRGFDVQTKKKTMSIEPQGKGIIHAYFSPAMDNQNGTVSRHYSPRRNGFYPALCCPISELKKDVIEYFKHKPL